VSEPKAQAPEHEGQSLPRHIVLVGMMGSGKTTVGHRVADLLARPFFDSDEMIEAREGRSVREIWLAEGEPAYRSMETAVLREALAADEPSVVAAAGGVVLREENRRLLEADGVFTVRLYAAPEVLATRVGHQGHRPLLDDDPLGALRRMVTERESLYAEVADATIDVGHRGVDEVVDCLMDLVAA
jgi:shikimate kinase